jgi:hypothetical protein
MLDNASFPSFSLFLLFHHKLKRFPHPQAICKIQGCDWQILWRGGVGWTQLIWIKWFGAMQLIRHMKQNGKLKIF